MKHRTRHQPSTILGTGDSTFAVHEKPAASVPSEDEKRLKPTTLQIWIGSAGLAIWMWWMALSWGMVVVATLNLAFEPPFWYWLIFALLGVGFRFVLEAWGAKVQGITDNDYDPNKYPWWARKIRPPRR